MKDYLSIEVNHPPLDKKIIIKKSKGVFSDSAKIVTLKIEGGSLDYHVWDLTTDGFDLWRLV